MFKDNSETMLAEIEYSKKYQRDYYQRNKEKKLAYARTYKEKYGAEINAKRRKAARLQGVPERNHLNPPVSAKDNLSEYNKYHHHERVILKRLTNKIKAFQKVSGSKVPICCKCGEKNVYVLCINHINGGGRKEFGTNKYYKFIADILSGTRDVTDLDLRCQNCNILYEYERGYRKYHRDWGKLYKELTNV